MDIFTRRIFTAACAILLSGACHSVQAQAITEGFDNITTLSSNGWSLQNLSSPTGTTGWFQGNTSVFTAQNGAANAYIAADKNNTSGSGTISNWLITPARTLKNGDVITFYTRARALSLSPDRLQVRMSSNGSSANVGSTATSVGDFTDLLLEINATQTILVYPANWNQYTITLSGLATPVSGRIAFRYYVTNGGPSGGNSDYIGIDNFTYSPVPCPAITILPANLPNGVVGNSYSQTFTQNGGTNPTTYAATGSLPPGLTLTAAGVLSGTPTVSGAYTFSVTGTNTTTSCSGTRTYTLIINCGTNNASLAAFTPVCSNASPVTLTGGTPAGGTYSGTGVTNGMFDPAVGTQVITYSYVDGSGCTNSASQTFTVNQAPNILFTNMQPVCSDALPFTVNNVSPLGGSFSGNGLNGNVFSPSAGTQTITYSYTAGNGCSATSTETITVNAAPTVTLAGLPGVTCRNDTAITLTGGMPAGGLYSGSFVTNDMFIPAQTGKYTIGYTYTDPNGCPGSAVQNIEVIDCPLAINTVVADNKTELSLECYPNPANGILHAKISHTEAGKMYLRIASIQGQMMMFEETEMPKGIYERSFDLTSYPKGYYIMEIRTANSRAYQKILLQ